MRRISATVFAVTLALGLLSGSAARAAITADNLLLVVNKQQPAGRQIAERYAALRHVPADRIVEIDVIDRDNVDPEIFETHIATVVRQAIEERGLRPQIRCIVTFYGVPLRVVDRAIKPLERLEVTQTIDPMIAPLRQQLAQTVEQIEAVAREVDPNFKPLNLTLDNAEQIRSRGAQAERAIREALVRATDDGRRQAMQAKLVEVQRRLSQMPPLPGLPPPSPGATTRPAAEAAAFQKRLSALLAKPGDADARREVRTLVYGEGNVVLLLGLLERQKAFLTAGEGEASVDSELACLYLDRNYPRTKWLANPFQYASRAYDLRAGIVRTCRIDGPTADAARRVVEDCVAVEAAGLKGDAVLDARGLADNGGVVGSYEGYDRSIRDAAKLFDKAADLRLIFDDKADLLPDGTSERAAIYCGWYRVRRYAPTVRCVPGSVAFHVASLEMMSLHAFGENGWCRGLMNDGATVTMGAVGEPFLFAFPPADEFLGLLLTGKPTLVEAYWSTIPVVSWKLVLIGDPLYRPFATNPAIEVTRLPEPLRNAAEQ